MMGVGGHHERILKICKKKKVSRNCSGDGKLIFTKEAFAQHLLRDNACVAVASSAVQNLLSLSLQVASHQLDE